MTTFLENVTDKPDIQKSVIFRELFVKKCQFCTFPLGLDRVFDISVSPVHSWCHWWCQWCQFRHFRQKPLGLDRVLVNFSKKTTKNHFFPLLHTIETRNTQCKRR